MHRIVEPEILDELAPADSLAAGSRRDLRRLNSIMGHAGILDRAVGDAVASDSSGRFRICELGAGDGTLLLKLARRWAKRGVTADVTFLDRQNLVSAETHRAFETLNWSIECLAVDVFVGLERLSANLDLIVANLFLHHFQDPDLRALLRLAASRTKLFAACEPRRSGLALIAAQLLRFVGCNSVTRHDGVVSVRAGFRKEELSALWPVAEGWQSDERAAGLFSHCFAARRSGPTSFG